MHIGMTLIMEMNKIEAVIQQNQRNKIMIIMEIFWVQSYAKIYQNKNKGELSGRRVASWPKFGGE